MKKVLTAFCLVAALPALALAGAQAGQGEPLATIDGAPIYEQDLAAEVGPKLLALSREEYNIKSKALEDVIRKKVLEAEARRRGISVDDLLKQVDAKVPEPSEAEIEGYYLAIRNQTSQPFDELKPQLEKAVKLLKIQQARQEFEDSLRAKEQVAVLLQPPRVEVSYDPARVRGNTNAPVTIVEFADFQCPYCRKAQDTLKDLLARYHGEVKLAYRDFPMRQLHPRAERAAEAGRCAEAQGKFWEYHDALFADPSKLDDTDLTATAQKLGLDEKAFDACLDAGKYKSQVEEDVQAGAKAGVAGTPAFFINGEFLSGAQPETAFEKIIDAELKDVGSPHAGK